MATNFKVGTIVLNRQLLTATGDALYLNGKEIIAGVSGSLTLTGVQLGAQINSLSGWTNTVVSGGLETRIIATGGSAVTHSNGIGVSLSGALTNSGVALINRDLVISGTLATGIGATGQAAWISANGAANTLSGQLTTTGQTIYTILTGLSGQSAIDYATKTQLTNTGVALGAQITSLSGFTTGVSGYLAAQIAGFVTAATLTQTGVVLGAKIDALSGWVNTTVSGGLEVRLIATGVSVLTHVNGGLSILSGNMSATGAALASTNLITSGTLATGIFNSGAAAWASANGAATALSGNATLSGITLMNRDLLVSGWLSTGLAATGTAAVTHSNGSASILSGLLTTTGQTLFNYLTGISGQSNLVSGFVITVSGALQTLIAGGGSQVKVTGSSILPTANFTGVGGTLVYTVGSTVFISGYSGSAGGGGVSQGQLDALSGYAESIYVHRTGDELITGVKSFASAILITGTFDQGYGNRATGPYAFTAGTGNFAAVAYSFAQGSDTRASGVNSHTEGEITRTLGDSSHAEGRAAFASGNYSHAEGFLSIAKGVAAHAEGGGSVAAGDYSHSEGSSFALGNQSHAEGNVTTAAASYSHSEGNFTQSIGIGSHAEGDNTFASGNYSHAEGNRTVAQGPYSHAQGVYNRVDVSGLFQVGRGTNGEVTGRADVIYVSDSASNRSILSGDWTVSTGFRVYNTPVVTGLIAGSSNVTVNNNNNGTFTVNAVISGTSSSSSTTTGTYIFRTAITSGVSQQFINFPVTLAANPRVLATVYSNYVNTILPVQISGAVSTGFWALYGNTVTTSGYFLDAMGITSDTGLAATVINQNTSYAPIQLAASDQTSAITAGFAKMTFRMPYAGNLTGVRASVAGAPAGSTIIFDINQSGYSVLSTKLTIDANEKTSVTAATPAVISTGYLPDDTEITVDFDQVGSTNAGTGVMITLYVNPT